MEYNGAMQLAKSNRMSAIALRAGAASGAAVVAIILTLLAGRAEPGAALHSDARSLSEPPATMLAFKPAIEPPQPGATSSGWERGTAVRFRVSQK